MFDICYQNENAFLVFPASTTLLNTKNFKECYQIHKMKV